MFSKFPQYILFADNFPGLSCDSTHFASRDTIFVPEHHYKNIFTTNRLRRQRVSLSRAKIRFTYGPGRQDSVSLRKNSTIWALQVLGSSPVTQPAACTSVNRPPVSHSVGTGAWRTGAKTKKADATTTVTTVRNESPLSHARGSRIFDQPSLYQTVAGKLLSLQARRKKHNTAPSQFFTNVCYCRQLRQLSQGQFLVLATKKL